MPRTKYFAKDATDVPFAQMLLGAGFGYLAGSVPSSAPSSDASALIASLLAYRLVHQLGFIELNVRRHPRHWNRRRRHSGQQDGGGAASAPLGGAVEEPVAFVAGLVEDNKFLLGAIAAGFLVARAQTKK